MPASRTRRNVLVLFGAAAIVGALVLAFSPSSRPSDFRISIRPSPADWQIGTGLLTFGPPDKRPRYYQFGPFVVTTGFRAIAEEFMRPRESSSGRTNGAAANR